MRALAFMVLASAGLALAGCAEESPSSPGLPESLPPEIAGHGCLLTIDVASEVVKVQAPRLKAASAVSFSLLGRDAVRLDASACTFSAIPNNAAPAGAGVHLYRLTGSRRRCGGRRSSEWDRLPPTLSPAVPCQPFGAVAQVTVEAPRSSGPTTAAEVVSGSLPDLG